MVRGASPRSWRIAFLVSCGLGSIGCRRAPPPDASATAPPVIASPPPTPPPVRAPTVHIERETPIRESSGLVLGRVSGQRRAFVADEDDAAIVEVDLETNTVARSTSLGTRPRDLILLADGTLAATLPDANAVVLLAREESGGLRETKRAALPVEPIAIGLSPDDSELFVSTGASHTLVKLGAAALDERRRWDLPSEPRAVLVANDGQHVFVSHASESVVSIVPLEEGKEIAARDIGHGPLFLTDSPSIPRRHARNAQALVRIGERGVVVPAAQALPNPPLSSDFPMPRPRSGASEDFDLPSAQGAKMSGYGVSDFGGEPVLMDVATLDASEGSLVKGPVIRAGTSCLLPRAAIAVNDRVLVACLGSSRIEQLDDPHGRSAMAVLNAIAEVPRGPSAIASSRDGEHVFVWSAFARKLSRLATQADLRRIEKPSKRPRPPAKGIERRPSSEIEVPRSVARDESWLRGRELFYSNVDTRISADNRACATCHVDGRDDGLTWSTPAGPRRTRVLAGQLENGPYGWRGEHPTLEAHVKVTFRQLRGTGLPEAELAALLTYVRSLPRPPVRKSPDVTRGKELFASAECGSCHGDGGSDRNVHDVGTGGGFMTPTLAGIGGRRQLMHDGRYADLDALLVGAKAMGAGSSLSADDRHALVSYLETL